MSKLEKANEALQRSLAGARKLAKENESDLTRKGVGMVTSFAIGSLTRSGGINVIPTLPGVPRTISLAIIANGIGLIAPKGKWRDMLDGVGESTLNIASYEFGKGGVVAGSAERAFDDSEIEGRRRRRRRAAQNAARQMQDTMRQEAQSQGGGEDDEYEDLPYETEYDAAA